MTIELISITKPHSQSTRIIVIAIDESKTADHILDWSCKHLLRAETDQVFIVNARPFLREVIPIITHAPSVQIVDDQPSCADRVPREKSHFIIGIYI